MSLLALLASAALLTAAPAAPVQIFAENAPTAIPGQYIVVFQDSVAFSSVQAVERKVKELGGTIVFRYTSSLIGFSVKISPSAVAALRELPGLAFIEADQRFRFDTIQPPNPPANPPTGLDRIDRRLLPLNTRYTYNETGAGVHVYVIDSGVQISHADFGGRAFSNYSVTSSLDDCLGHGTHVAGTIGGTAYGVAKLATLHSVRVGDAACAPSASSMVMGLDWVAAHRDPMVANVANMSISGPVSVAVDTSASNLVAAGVTLTLAAGNSAINACNVSPARLSAAITVGATDPNNDNRAGFSNVGPCLDLFAPGVDILSAMPDVLPAMPGCTIVSATPGARSQRCSGTSMAAPHVAGVAARYLQNHTSSTPAQVWNRIHFVADVFSVTPLWPGILPNPGTGSPNELLHYGSLNDGYDDGDPHLTTVDGTHYDFQSGGEFVTLVDGGGLQIQTRQTPVATTFNPGANPHTGLATCVSLNTAIAARVGRRRVTYQPNLNGIPDPSGLQLRVDGVLTSLGANGVDLGAGGRVLPTGGGAIRIEFPDGTILLVTPGWWASQGKWYLNVSVLQTQAMEGIMGAMAPGSWLPALPDGTSVGPLPASLHQRYVDLNQKFADAWRVTDTTSLFDYAPGTSTKTFTFPAWPAEEPPCVLPRQPPVKPADPQVAQRACRAITDRSQRENCVFDVTVTGEPGFAKTYQQAQQALAGSTKTTLEDDKDPTQVGEGVTFTATVARAAAAGKGIPAGTVQFLVDGANAGKPVKLDANGRAVWKTSTLKAGDHRVTARYIPAGRGGFLASSSQEELHRVVAPNQPPVTISNLPMQGGNEKTPCPEIGVVYKRSDAASVPYLGIVLPVLDLQCGSKGPGLVVATVKFLRCAPDPRGVGFGPNASADLTCTTPPPPVTIPDLPMQGGSEKTPCPEIGVVYKRSDAASVPYLGIVLPVLDLQCGSKGPGLLVATVKFLRCAPDPRGAGFGPNASADVTCAK